MLVKHIWDPDGLIEFIFGIFFYIILPILGLILSIQIFRWIKQIKLSSAGTDKMQAIALLIRDGAYTYMKAQSFYIAIVSCILMFIILFTLSISCAVSFLVGVILSCLSGYIGMYISVQANVRTAQAASVSLNDAFRMAIKSGAVIGFTVTILSYIGYCFASQYGGIVVMMTNLSEDASNEHINSVKQIAREIVNMTLTFCLGASLSSVFARLGGGIFTKGADVGADIVGKIDIGLNEDDARNPAVIADSIGDNVGDCAGMSADLFETYAVTLCGAYIMCMMYDPERIFDTYIIPIVGMISCYIGFQATHKTYVKDDNSIMKTLYKSVIISGCSAMVLSACTLSIWALLCCMFGTLLMLAVMYITEYYTSFKYRPVQQIVKASETGHGTNVIAGLAVSLESALLPVLTICILLISSVLVVYYLIDSKIIYSKTPMHTLYVFISMVSVYMLSYAPIIMTLDAYGPITDNAGGIAEMSGMHEDVRKQTDILDTVGNTTKAITKGYAVCAAAIAGSVLLSLYSFEVKLLLDGLSQTKYLLERQAAYFEDILPSPIFLIGMLIGAAATNLFASYSMRAVGKTGSMVAEAVRMQVKNNPKILTGEQSPDYNSIVTRLTEISVQQMIMPVIVCFTPVFAYFSTFMVLNIEQICMLIGGILLSNIVTGTITAISMTSGGGAWDNAKKYIEQIGKKGSDMHKASVTGDTVGDPYKDTAGPALNPMIKAVNIIAIIMLIIVKHLTC